MTDSLYLPTYYDDCSVTTWRNKENAFLLNKNVLFLNKISQQHDLIVPTYT